MKGRLHVFIKNTLILAISALLLRVVGVYFNVYLSDKLGNEGLGILTLTFSVYGLATTFATSAINLTATRMVADAEGSASYSDVKIAMRKCIAYCLFFGLGTMMLLLIIARPVALGLLGDSRTLSSVRVLALTLPFVSLSSAVSGYFTAVRRVLKSASVQIFQMLFRVALTVCFLSLLGHNSLERSCLFTVLAMLFSEIVSFLLLCISFVIDINKKYGEYREKESEDLKKKMLGIALPTAFTSYFRASLVTLEHLLITSGLKKSGMSQSESLSAYGVMQAKALPTVLFPYCFLSPFCSLLVPEIAEKRAAGDDVGIRRISERACKIVLSLGICVSGIVACYSAEIGALIYSDSEAGYYIRILAPVMPIMFIDTTIDSILKGLDEQLYTMKVNLFDSLMSVGIVFLLIPKIGMVGYVIEIIFCEIVNTSLSASRLISRSKIRVDVLRWIALPIGASFVSIWTVRFVLSSLGLGFAANLPRLCLHILLAVGLYCVVMRLFSDYFPREMAEIFGKRKYMQKKT